MGATQAPALAVTDRRLLIVRYDVEPERSDGPWWRRWFGPARRTAHPVRGLSLTDVLGAVRAPAGLLRRGQLLVGFTDGSTRTLVPVAGPRRTGRRRDRPRPPSR